MRTIEMIVTVNEEGIATLKLPADIPPGDHRAVLVLDDTVKQPVERLSFPRHDICPWPFGPAETFRREDMYGNDGR